MGASCAPARRPSAPVPAPPPPQPLIPAAIPAPNPKLPPVPAVRGPLQISVTYPKPDQLLTVRDSNFIFGTVGTGDAALRINGVAVPVWPNGAFMGWLPVPPDSAPRYELLAGNSTATARLTLPVRVPPRPDTTPREPLVGDTLNPVPPPDSITPISRNVYVALGPPSTTVSDTDRVVIARPAPGNGQQYKWFLFSGTVVKVTGSKKASGDEFVRIELDSAQEAWVLESELQARHISTTPPETFIGDSLAPVRRLGAVRIEPTADWIDIVIPVTGPPPPYLVEEGERSISLLLYGVGEAPVVSMMPQSPDTYLNSVSSTPEPTRVRFGINLNRAPYGYLALWRDSTLTFRVRRPPTIADPAVTASWPDHHRRPRTSSGGRDRSDDVVRRRRRARGRIEAEGHAHPEGRERRDDTHHARAGRPGTAADNQPPSERPRLRLDPPQCISGWRQPIREQRHTHALFLAALDSARRRDAGGASRASSGCATMGRSIRTSPSPAGRGCPPSSPKARS